MTEVTIDASGLRCPKPIIMLAKHISDIAIGDSLRLIADDAAAVYDVPAWCRMTKHELVSSENSVFLIRRTS
jgi:TusA-related sulfurtransferase